MSQLTTRFQKHVPSKKISKKIFRILVTSEQKSGIMLYQVHPNHELIGLPQ